MYTCYIPSIYVTGGFDHSSEYCTCIEEGLAYKSHFLFPVCVCGGYGRQSILEFVEVHEMFHVTVHSQDPLNNMICPFFIKCAFVEVYTDQTEMADFFTLFLRPFVI